MKETAGSPLRSPQPASFDKEAMMSAEHFDIAVVGGGKDGKTLAAKMASAGRRVAWGPAPVRRAVAAARRF